MDIQSVEERFQQLQQYIISCLVSCATYMRSTKKCTEVVLQTSKNLEKSLMHNGSKDTGAEDLCCECIAVTQRPPKSMLPQGVLLFIVQQELLDRVPNVSVALWILLTLPVSVASGGECCFSKLKLMQTYLCSTMLQSRLVDVATILVEHAKATAIHLKESVTKFAKGKACKMRF
ncbi:hypothetical protein JRQ81_002691 [Phrynocephalus forsythii]|uniref:HAT C-terminal dimerisation domain-containing protein n=1 Tax=Phrynocephalus forsythii TaxID=171643 RepID=A0A9Q1AWS1_9SAUR|nr:hypothetical protein JRQ81_002691 [Phrynocephalus forsythii]